MKASSYSVRHDEFIAEKTQETLLHTYDIFAEKKKPKAFVLIA